MSVEANLPVIIASMGHVQRIAHKEMAHPEAQQASARQTTPEELKHAHEQVEKTDASEATQLKTEKDGGGAQQQADSRKKRRKKEPEPAEEHKALDDKGPWQGNIVNLKV